MPERAMHTREGDKPHVMLYLADCGARDGLSEQQKLQLDILRLEVATAYETLDRGRIRASKTALLSFYQALPEIKNGSNLLSAEQAANGDCLRLKEAAKKYDPNHQHPNYRHEGGSR